mgnify:CR=1 FL=1
MCSTVSCYIGIASLLFEVFGNKLGIAFANLVASDSRLDHDIVTLALDCLEVLWYHHCIECAVENRYR